MTAIRNRCDIALNAKHASLILGDLIRDPRKLCTILCATHRWVYCSTRASRLRADSEVKLAQAWSGERYGGDVVVWAGGLRHGLASTFRRGKACEVRWQCARILLCNFERVLRGCDPCFTYMAPRWESQLNSHTANENLLQGGCRLEE